MSKSRTLGVVAALAALSLTGCGAIQPGVAVEVGDETITVSRLDEVSTEFCRAIEPQLQGQAESIQNSYLRSFVAGTLALRSVADQVASEYGVTPDSKAYLKSVTDLRASVAGVPEEIRDSVIEIQGAAAYVEAVQAAIGAEVADPSADDQQVAAAGKREFEAWISENGVEFDPSLNSEIKDGAFSVSDDALSFAVSQRAKSGMEAQPNSVAARELTDAQRCGR